MLLGLSIVLLLTACAQNTNNSRASFDSAIIETDKIDEDNLAVVSNSQSESIDEINAFPTSLRYDDSDPLGHDYKSAWERATLFFKLYLKDNLQIKLKGNQTQMFSQSKVFNYKVESSKIRTNSDNSYRINILVTDITGKNTIESELAAKNLARFIDKGELLVEMVK